MLLKGFLTGVPNSVPLRDLEGFDKGFGFLNGFLQGYRTVSRRVPLWCLRFVNGLLKRFLKRVPCEFSIRTLEEIYTGTVGVGSGM